MISLIYHTRTQVHLRPTLTTALLRKNK